MSAHNIVQRYAKSLIDLATEENALDAVIADVELVRESLKHREFYLMVKSPVVKPSSKRKVFAALFESRLHKITFGFLDILLRKSREAMMKDILDGAAQRYRDIKGITTIKLITAVAPDEQLLADIKKAIEALPEINEVDLSNKVDPDLIGGMVLDFGDRRIDASVRHELNQIRRKFQAANIRS
ncbi:MAG: ATP synthase F1 subunit delta [Saprospirales bacterium]|nr:MAG: ATP synthase F1 subunit delta [Saprospirales bacterium]